MNKSMIKKFYLCFSSFFIFIIHIPFVFAKVKPVKNVASDVVVGKSQNDNKNMLTNLIDENPVATNKPCVFDSLKLNSLGLSRQAYDYAVKGFNYLLSVGKLNNDRI